MDLFIWIIIFLINVVILIGAADLFINKSVKVGVALGVPPFIIGLTIISFGTTLPELTTSLFSVFRGATEIVAANAIGSIIVNILLVIGVSSVVAGALKIRKEILDLHLPILIGAVLILIIAAWDGAITVGESFLLVAGYFIYVFYIFSRQKVVKKIQIDKKERNLIGTRVGRKREILKELLAVKIEKAERKKMRKSIKASDVLLILLGGALVYFSARYIVESLINIAAFSGISPSIVAMSALAIGTSLPELVVSVMSVVKKRQEIGIGNIVGSNILNSFIIIGIPALFSPLVISQSTLSVGIPFMVVAVLFFTISMTDRKISRWEGVFYLLAFIIFVAKSFGVF